MSNIDPRELFKMLQEDAARLGISTEQLIKQITSGANVLGATGPTHAVAHRPTHMTTGEGRMPQIDDLNEGPEDDFDELVRQRHQALEEAGGDELAAEIIHRDSSNAVVNAQAPLSNTNPATAGGQLL